MFESLDFVYMPSRDAAGDVEFFTSTLGARLVFAVEGMGTRVAMVELTDAAASATNDTQGERRGRGRRRV